MCQRKHTAAATTIVVGSSVVRFDDKLSSARPQNKKSQRNKPKKKHEIGRSKGVREKVISCKAFPWMNAINSFIVLYVCVVLRYNHNGS